MKYHIYCCMILWTYSIIVTFHVRSVEQLTWPPWTSVKFFKPTESVNIGVITILTTSKVKRLVIITTILPDSVGLKNYIRMHSIKFLQSLMCKWSIWGLSFLCMLFSKLWSFQFSSNIPHCELYIMYTMHLITIIITTNKCTR